MAPRLRQPVLTRHSERMCPRCGYRGVELQGEKGRLVFACPGCRGDLYERPPRSYAEMEGLAPSRWPSLATATAVKPTPGAGPVGAGAPWRRRALAAQSALALCAASAGAAAALVVVSLVSST